VQDLVSFSSIEVGTILLATYFSIGNSEQ